MTDRRALWNSLRWRLGTSGVVACAVLLLAALYAAIVLPSMAEHQKQQRLELADLSQRGHAGSIASRRETTTGKLQDFYALLPKAQTTAGWLAKINQAAMMSGLTLQSGEYRLDRPADRRVVQYQITLPVVGTYAQVRAFVDAVLSTVPSASLDEIQLTRESTQSRSVSARLRFSLYLLADSA